MKNPYAILLTLLCPLVLCSQQLVPPIQNHSAVRYDAASQNWEVAIDDRGVLYAANNEGLLSYDGQRWELFALKNGGVIRSVLPFRDRIYTGSYRQFGYWKRNELGEMQYSSLMPLLEGPVESEEYWEILPFDDAIYFRSFGSIYKYQEDRIELVKKVITNKMVVYQDNLLIAVGKRGLFFLNPDGTLAPLPGQDLLSGKRVLDIEVDGDDLIVGTRDRLYTFDGKRFSVYPDPSLNAKLERYEFNHLMRIGKSSLLLATVRNGVLHHNMETGETAVYNRNSGLQNNTILSMAARDGNLWLGLDNGVDKIELDSPIRFYTDHSGELGAVYDLAPFENQLYAASNTGVYRIGRDLKMVEGAQGHSWNLEVIDDRLYSNHNSGTFWIQEDRFVPIDSRTGSFQILESPVNGRYLIGTYTGVSIYDRKSDSLLNLDTPIFPAKKIIFEDPSTAWVEHAHEGIYRFGLNDSYNDTTFFDKLNKQEEIKNHRPRIFKIKGQVALLRNENWYRYNAFEDTLELFKELKDFQNHELLLEDENGYWFTNRRNNAITYTNFDGTEVSISYGELDRRLVKGNERMVRAEDSIYYLTLNDGFAKIDLDEIIRYRQKESLNQPIVKGILDERDRYDLTAPVRIPYVNAKRVSFLAGLPGSGNISLRYELVGEEKIRGTVENGKLTFQNLPHGDYRLNLFALSPQGLRSEVSSVVFTVLAPWYLSLPMKVLYLVLLLLITLLVYAMNKRKLAKHRLLLEQKMEKEHQRRMEKLEKARLEDEIMMKRKELANTTLMAAKKNEVLMAIHGELSKDRDKFSNQYRLKHIMNRINQAVRNKDEWQVFETNFKEVHEDFSKDLLEQYPNLTGKDLKLCSYLKMNLTSKEIAPLMGKSLRGVEVHRYRLRKKMGLDSQENLSGFLIKHF